MDEVVVVGEEAGASSSTAGADSDDSLPQSAPIPLVESIDEALVPDIIAGTTGTSSVFQSAWVAPSLPHISHNTYFCCDMTKYVFPPSLNILEFLLFLIAVINCCDGTLIEWEFRHFDSDHFWSVLLSISI